MAGLNFDTLRKRKSLAYQKTGGSGIPSVLLLNALKRTSCYELFDGERRQDYSSGPTLTLKPKARRQARDTSSARNLAKDVNPGYRRLANRSANRYSALAILEDQSPVCPCFHVFFNFFSYRSSGLVRVRENQRFSLHQHGSSGMGTHNRFALCLHQLHRRRASGQVSSHACLA
jgi:hypothetical protein